MKASWFLFPLLAGATFEISSAGDAVFSATESISAERSYSDGRKLEKVQLSGGAVEKVNLEPLTREGVVGEVSRDNQGLYLCTGGAFDSEVGEKRCVCGGRQKIGRAGQLAYRHSSPVDGEAYDEANSHGKRAD